jgi:AcrR family transcriptional regulator
LSQAGAEPDPRVERTRRVVGEAALDLLAEVGYGGLTCEGVAARAGVGKATIYRHWRGKLDLVADAIASLKQPPPALPDGTFRERLVAHLRHVCTMSASSRWAEILPALISASARHPELREWHTGFTNQHRGLLVELLEAGVASGDLPTATDVDVLTDALVGPIFVRRLLLGRAVDEADVVAIIDQLVGPETPGGSSP